MIGAGGSTHVPPFPPEYRASGLLLHITSLPSPYGIGDLGARRFHSSTASMMPAKGIGSRFRSVPLATETRRINRCRRLPATPC